MGHFFTLLQPHHTLRGQLFITQRFEQFDGKHLQPTIFSISFQIKERIHWWTQSGAGYRNASAATESKQPTLRQRRPCVNFLKLFSVLCVIFSRQVWRQMERLGWTEGWEAERQRPNVMHRDDYMKADSQEGLLKMVRRQEILYWAESQRLTAGKTTKEDAALI